MNTGIENYCYLRKLSVVSCCLQRGRAGGIERLNVRRQLEPLLALSGDSRQESDEDNCREDITAVTGGNTGHHNEGHNNNSNFADDESSDYGLLNVDKNMHSELMQRRASLQRKFSVRQDIVSNQNTSAEQFNTDSSLDSSWTHHRELGETNINNTTIKHSQDSETTNMSQVNEPGSDQTDTNASNTHSSSCLNSETTLADQAMTCSNSESTSKTVTSALDDIDDRVSSTAKKHDDNTITTDNDTFFD